MINEKFMIKKHKLFCLSKKVYVKFKKFKICMKDFTKHFKEEVLVSKNVEGKLSVK